MGAAVDSISLSPNRGSRMSQQTITINGTVYDAHSGLPIEPQRASRATSADFPSTKAHHSHDMHSQTQKSHTLNRRVVKKHLEKPSTPATSQSVKKNHVITKFAPHPQGATPRPRMMADIGPSLHPIVKKAHERMQEPAKTPGAGAPPQPSAILKQEAIHKALQTAPSHAAAHKPIKRQPKKAQRIMSIASASLALLLLGGYFTYLNMPSLSVRVAAAQAGINASYPSYHPDGYGRGVVGYQNGEVSVKYASTAGPQNFTLTQEKTSLDTTALKENIVDKQWGDNIDIVAEHGLTIYRKDGDAMWVNGGILYTINGDAPLSPTQIRNIATSL
jgi:hypothetical protein